MSLRLLIVFILSGLALTLGSCEPRKEAQSPDSPTWEEGPKMTATVVFDNYPGPAGLRTGWGFACHVSLPETTVLFDTGADGGILVDNMLALDLAPDAIDLIVLSHAHGDHTGGLRDIVSLNPEAQVCMLEAFGADLKRMVRRSSCSLVESRPGQKLAPGVRTTGAVDGPPPEQALAIETAEGLVVITGCAHPGVDQMVSAVLDVCTDEFAMVLGGFHLSSSGRGQIQRTARSLQQMGVERAGPCHCSGDRAREVFANVFGNDYVPVHLGSRLEFALLRDE
jgi:7,8-dihydropterin-6-yl-methyl-4-(beta-D-ribofuranosyl)aminobenzene 5'-phosphate synthase